MLCSTEFYYLKYSILLFLLYMAHQYNTDVEDKQKKSALPFILRLITEGMITSLNYNKIYNQIEGYSLLSFLCNTSSSSEQELKRHFQGHFNLVTASG